MNRRHALRLAAALPGTLLLPIGHDAWATKPTAPRDPNIGRMVVVFLRGAVDGLSVVVPHSDIHYQRARPTLALGRPGADRGTLALNGQFGLHPSLAPLMPLWQAERLAFVHASGSPDATRSHFDAQDYMESGTPG